MIVTTELCVFLQISLTVQLNMSERENGQVPLAKRTIRSRISSEHWEQIKVAYVSGIGLREIARKMNIPREPSLRTIGI